MKEWKNENIYDFKIYNLQLGNETFWYVKM